MAYNVDWVTNPTNPIIHGHSADEIVIPVVDIQDTTNLANGTMWLVP